MKIRRCLKLIIALLLIVLLVACTKTTDDMASDSINQTNTTDLFSDVDIIVSGNFDDGKVYEIQPTIENLSEFDSQQFLEDTFGAYEIYISPRQLGKISERFSVEFFKANKISFIHYNKFDIIYVEYEGYRASRDGTLFIFENGIYKGCVEGKGRIDASDVIKTIDGTVWLVSYKYYGGIGLSGEEVNWIDLTSIDLNIITVYYSFEFSGFYYVYQSYKENFVEFKYSDDGRLVAVTNYTEKISDPEKVIVFERSGEREILIDQYTNTLRPDFTFTMPMLEENLSAIEEYSIKGSPEEQQVANEMLEFYNQRKD